ncbi:MAG: response regulator [Verrucomicrobiales bacterium]
MDDEAAIRRSASLLLSRFGHTVAEAAHGEEALEKYRAAKAVGEPFDVVLMDLTIPGAMGGKDAVLRLREIDPDAKAIVFSGYSNDPIMADPAKHGFNGSLQKPFEPAELSALLQQILTERERAAA